MPVQIIELELVQKLEVSDESLEAIAMAAGYTTNTACAQNSCISCNGNEGCWM
jgi:hypothetical protein